MSKKSRGASFHFNEARCPSFSRARGNIAVYYYSLLGRLSSAAALMDDLRGFLPSFISTSQASVLFQLYVAIRRKLEDKKLLALEMISPLSSFFPYSIR